MTRAIQTVKDMDAGIDRQQLKDAGFTPIRRSPRRLVCNVQSIKKSAGKTRFAFTAPKPIGYISVEIGSEEGPAENFIPDGADSFDGIQIVRIRMEEPEYPDPSKFAATKEGQREYDEAISAAVQAAAQPAWDKFYNAYYTSIKNMRTTVIDTGTDLYQLQRLANFGRLEKIPQLAYAQLKREFAKLFDDVFATEGNLIVISHMKDRGETIKDERTGKDKWIATGVYEMDGSNVVSDKVQAMIEMWREDLQEEDEETGMKVKFHAAIIDSRHNPQAMGKEFTTLEISFSDLAQAIFPKSKREDWE